MGHFIVVLGSAPVAVQSLAGAERGEGTRVTHTSPATHRGTLGCQKRAAANPFLPDLSCPHCPIPSLLLPTASMPAEQPRMSLWVRGHARLTGSCSGRTQPQRAAPAQRASAAPAPLGHPAWVAGRSPSSGRSR